MDVKIPEIVKDRWPLFLGGGIGVYIVWRYMARPSASASMSVPSQALPVGAGSGYSSLAAANSQASLTAMAQQNAKEVAIAQVYSGGQNDNVEANTGMAAALGLTAANIINALNMPAINAINSASETNDAALNAAASAAGASFAAQASIVNSLAQSNGTIADGNVALSRAVASGGASALYGSDSSYNNPIGAGYGQASSAASSADAASDKSTADTLTTVGMGLISAFSDSKVKKNIDEVTRDSLSEICEIDFKSFDYIEDLIGTQPHKRVEVGLIAQQAMEINPKWVIPSEYDYLRLNLPALLMSCLHAIKQLNEEVSELKTAREKEVVA